MADDTQRTGHEPVDPVYEALFRPEDLDSAPPAAQEPPEDHHSDPQTRADSATDPEALTDEPADLPREGSDSADEPAAAEAPDRLPMLAAPAAVDTGRLFRSQGIGEDTTAVLAADHVGRLRTLVRDWDEADGQLAAGQMMDDEAVDSRRRAQRSTAGAGIPQSAVYLIIIGLTLIVGLLNAWIGSGELGWPTGVALLVSSVYCALRVRPADDVLPIIVPPVAFFLTAVTAGQMFRGATGGDLVNRAQLVFFTFAYNWYWVVGATALALVIALVRRLRDR